MKQFTVVYRAPRAVRFAFIDAESTREAKLRVLDRHPGKSVTILSTRENNPPLPTITGVTA